MRCLFCGNPVDSNGLQITFSVPTRRGPWTTPRRVPVTVDVCVDCCETRPIRTVSELLELARATTRT